MYYEFQTKMFKRTKIQIKVRQHQKLSFLHVYEPANDQFVHVTCIFITFFRMSQEAPGVMSLT